MSAVEKLNQKRPLSPHLQIWRWTITMASSIMHRATGIALYVGTVLLTTWLAAAAFSASAFQKVGGFLDSSFGRVILFGFTWAVLYHLFNGVRHLFWDAGHGLSLGTARKSAWLIFIAATILTIAIWAYGLNRMGA